MRRGGEGGRRGEAVVADRRAARRMHRRLAALMALLAAALVGSPASAAPPQFIRGMALGHYTDIKNVDLDRKLRELKDLGVSHVSLVVSWSTRDVRSSEIAPRKRHTTPDRVLKRMIRRTRRAGFKVLLFPIVDVQRRKPLEWRGTIKPGKGWDAWWSSYEKFTLHYARIAARSRVEMLCIGSELVSTEKMRDRWVRLIDQVRTIYKGALLYSANWDHYKPVTFWDKVDVVGLTGYYKLAKKPNAGEAEMVSSWRKVRKQLATWSRKIKRQIIFTELGYPSMDGSAVHPWDYTLAAPPDLEEQRRAFSAFITAWRSTPELAGVFFWDWYGDGGPTDTRYTPRGKPAAGVIRTWFRGLVGTPVHR
jgi:Glycoside Hydrolase Family 113